MTEPAETVTPAAFPAARDDPQLEITSESPRRRIVVLRLRGEADLAVRDRLAGALDLALAGGVELLVLDLSDLRFLDSSGLHELAKANTRMRSDGHRLVLANPRHIKHALSIAGMGADFEVEPDVRIALHIHG